PENFATKTTKSKHRPQQSKSVNTLNPGRTSAFIKLVSSFTLKSLILKMRGRLNRTHNSQEVDVEPWEDPDKEPLLSNTSYGHVDAKSSGNGVEQAALLGFIRLEPPGCISRSELSTTDPCSELPSPIPELPSPIGSELPNLEWSDWLDSSAPPAYSEFGLIPVDRRQELDPKCNIEPTSALSFGCGYIPTSSLGYGSIAQDASSKMSFDIQSHPAKGQHISWMNVGNRIHHQRDRGLSSPVQISPYQSPAATNQSDQLEGAWALPTTYISSNLDGVSEQNSNSRRLTNIRQTRIKHTENALYKSDGNDSTYHRQAGINYSEAWQNYSKRMLVLYDENCSQAKANVIE
ncbi:MAG: hypothetical protein Q9167_002865, partial [Letrouitia subvulpina]